MNPQPKLQLRPSGTDKVLDRAALLLLVALWALSIIAYTRLPDIIPIHFDAAGEPNDFGGKEMLFVLPVIATFITLLLGALNTVPQAFNYPVPITETNAESQYRTATRFIRWLRISLLATFLLVVAYAWSSAANAKTRHGPWLMAGILVMTLLPLAVYLLVALRGRTTGK